MSGQRIKLFMWGYQPHFRVDVEISMNAVMKELGVPEAGAECLLVGARIPCHENPNEVCVEPEEGKWPLSLFDGLLEAIEAEASHPTGTLFTPTGRAWRKNLKISVGTPYAGRCRKR